jgi:cadmium resistance protein CadD (predicted permease)
LTLHCLLGLLSTFKTQAIIFQSVFHISFILHRILLQVPAEPLQSPLVKTLKLFSRKIFCFFFSLLFLLLLLQRGCFAEELWRCASV